MENPWEHIKDDIRNQETPLSEGAWENMSAMLVSQKKIGNWRYALLAVLLLGAGGLGLFKYQESWSDSATERQDNVVMPSEFGNTIGQTKEKVAKGGIRELIDSAQKGANVSDLNKAAVVPENLKGEGPGTSSQLGGLEEKPKTKPNLVAGSRMDLELVYLDKKLLIFDDYEGGDRLIYNEIPESGKKENKRRMFTGAELKLFAASTYNMPNLSYNSSGNDIHKEYSEKVDDGVKAGWGYDAGIELSIQLFNNIRISTGFGFREIVTQNSYGYGIDEIPVIDSASGDIITYIHDNTPIQVSEYSKNSFTYLNLPVSLFYEWPINHRWSITGEAIHNFSFLIKAQGKRVNSTNLQVEEASQQDVSKSINSYQLRLGLRYALSEKLALALEPSYRSYYQDFYTQGPVSWKPSDFSINVSAIIKLK